MISNSGAVRIYFRTGERIVAEGRAACVPHVGEDVAIAEDKKVTHYKVERRNWHVTRSKTDIYVLEGNVVSYSCDVWLEEISK